MAVSLLHTWQEKIPSSSYPATSVTGTSTIARRSFYAHALPRGTRFQYTFYYPKPPPSSTPAIRLSRSDPSPAALKDHPIYASISALDHEAMELLTMPPFTAAQAHHDFADYLARTKNTICGRHPIGVLFGALTTLEKEGKTPKLKWVRYEQSSQCMTIKDSSVSYASAFVTF